MHPVRHHEVEEALIVGDDQHGAVGAAQRVDAAGDDLERVDVEARIGLVEDRERRFQQRHLQYLVALLLAAREAHVERAPHHAVVDAERRPLRLDQLEELHRVQFLLAAMPAAGVDRGLEEGGTPHARNLDRVLEGEEDAGERPFLDAHGQQVRAPPGYRAAGHRVALAAGDHVGQRALAGAVGPHDRVHLALVQRQVEAVQDRLAVGGRVQVFDRQHRLRFRL